MRRRKPTKLDPYYRGNASVEGRSRFINTMNIRVNKNVFKGTRGSSRNFHASGNIMYNWDHPVKGKACTYRELKLTYHSLRAIVSNWTWAKMKASRPVTKKRKRA